jgi:ribose/xylose/arabinose/galactoside ABC-type transport system permease subunit
MKTRLLWPLVILAILLLINILVQPNFFTIEMKSGHLFGSLIDILRNAAPLIIVSLGLTLVIATKGIDLSIGSVMAISGAMACLLVKSGGFAEDGYLLLLVCITAALLLSAVAGAWNGILVAGIKMQPIVATLILMVAGRGIAQLIGNGQIITVDYKPFLYLGKGYFLTLPFSIYIVVLIFVLAALLTRKTALGLFIESVGSNPVASRLTGTRAFVILIIVYVFCGFCSGIAGVIASSNVASADGNNLGNLYELDAILAVVIGGTSLNGGRFYLTGTLLGALIIQTLSTTIYSVGVPNQMILVVKAIVVLIVCLLQAEEFRKKVLGKIPYRKTPSKKGVAV